MLRLKKNGVKIGGLLVGSFFCVGFAHHAEAIGLKLPTSIHEILTPEKIAEIKANPAVRDIQNGMMKQAINDQATTRSAAMMGSMNQNVLNAVQEAIKKRTQQRKIMVKQQAENEDS